MAEVEVILGWRGRPVVDGDGDRIGKLDEIYVDRETGKPEFAVVDLGLLGLKSRLVPLAGAASAEEKIKVPYTQEQVKEAPDLELDGEPKPEDEAKLYRHYGLDYHEAKEEEPETGEGAHQAAERTAFDTGLRDKSSSAEQPKSARSEATGDQEEQAKRGRSDSGSRGTADAGEPSAEGGDRGHAEGDPATTEPDAGRASQAGRNETGAGNEGELTRSEEELQVGTEKRPRARARLKKYVVTEEVQQTVPVKREEVRVEREPIDEPDAATDSQIGEGEAEVVLHEEQPVAQKRTVPKERVRLDKEVISGQEDVSEPVRKERVEVEREEAQR
jgi:uncharacterized protein (TIGR02271 family)